MTRRRLRVVELLASAQLAAWLIGAQVIFLLVSFVVPQTRIFPHEQVDAFLRDIPALFSWLVRALSFDNVFASPLFYASATLLVVNLMVCTLRRIGRRLAVVTTGGGAVPESARRAVVLQRERAEAALTAAGFRETHAEDGVSRYYLRRGFFGFVGSIVLHGALVLAIAGGVTTALTTFRGTMVFTEGQSHADTPQDYLTVDELPVLGTAFRSFQITLDKMEFTYEQGEVVDAVADFQVVRDGRVEAERAKVNYPLSVAGKSFLLRDAGHSVAITVATADGAVVVDSFVNLLGSSELGYRDSLALPDGQLFIASRPDGSKPLEDPVSEGLVLSSPVVGLSLSDSDRPDGYSWVTPGGDDAQLGQYTVSVHEVRIWNSFLVRADGGRYVTYAAFLLIILGSMVRFLDPDRWVKAALGEHADGYELSLWGAQRYRVGALPKEGERVLRALLEDQNADTAPEEAEGDRA